MRCCTVFGIFFIGQDGHLQLTTSLLEHVFVAVLLLDTTQQLDSCDNSNCAAHQAHPDSSGTKPIVTWLPTLGKKVDLQ